MPSNLNIGTNNNILQTYPNFVKTIDNIRKRTDTLPWQLCALLADEIEGVIPNRAGSSKTD